MFGHRFLAYPTGISVNPTGARKCRFFFLSFFLSFFFPVTVTPLFSPFFGTQGVGEGHPAEIEYLTNYIDAWYNNKCILPPPIFQHLFV